MAIANLEKKSEASPLFTFEVLSFCDKNLNFGLLVLHKQNLGAVACPRLLMERSVAKKKIGCQKI